MKIFTIYKFYRHTVFLFSLILMVLMNNIVFGDVIYVDVNAGGANNGLSWTNAYNDLQFALNSASSGDQIWVAKGTYFPATNGDRSASFNIPDGVEVYGGFAGTESSLAERTDYGVGGTNETILSGDIGTGGDQNDNSYHVVKFSSSVSSSTILDGFTITGGYALDGVLDDDFVGAGIFVEGSPTISQCTIENNNSWSDGPGLYIYNNSGTITPGFSNCTIKTNTAQFGYGGISNEAEGATVNSSFTNCTIISNNINGGAGGGIFNFSDNSGNCYYNSNKL